MKVIRWGAGLAMALCTAAAAAVVAAPSALAASGVEAVGLAERGAQIASFNTADPSKVKVIGSVAGLDGDRLIGIDFRPKDHRLYGVSTRGRIYTLDTKTAKATEVGKLTTAIQGSYWDIDFSAAGDFLRIVTDKGQNLRQPFGANGPSGNTVKEGNLSRTPIAALGYTGSGQGLAIDTGRSQIVSIDGASGKVTPVGPTGAFGKVSTSSNGLDVQGSSAFATVNLNHYHTLFRVDPARGTVTKIGTFHPTGDGAESFRHVIDLTIRR
jgi:hypothetical protein